MSTCASRETDNNIGLLLLREAEQRKALQKLDDRLSDQEEEFQRVARLLGEATDDTALTDTAYLLEILDQIDPSALKRVIQSRIRLIEQWTETKSKLIRSGVSVQRRRTRPKA